MPVLQRLTRARPRRSGSAARTCPTRGGPRRRCRCSGRRRRRGSWIACAPRRHLEAVGQLRRVARLEDGLPESAGRRWPALADHRLRALQRRRLVGISPRARRDLRLRRAKRDHRAGDGLRRSTRVPRRRCVSDAPTAPLPSGRGGVRDGLDLRTGTLRGDGVWPRARQPAPARLRASAGERRRCGAGDQPRR